MSQPCTARSTASGWAPTAGRTYATDCCETHRTLTTTVGYSITVWLRLSDMTGGGQHNGTGGEGGGRWCERLHNRTERKDSEC